MAQGKVHGQDRGVVSARGRVTGTTGDKKQETRTARTIGTMAGTRTAAQTGREDRRWEGEDNRDGRGILRRRQRMGTTTSEGKAGGPKRISNINISKIKKYLLFNH